MAEDTGGEKVLPPSARKKQKAREDGNIAKSQDLSSAVALSVALLALFIFGPRTLHTLIASGEYFIGNAHELTLDQLPLRTLAMRAFYVVGSCVFPFMLVMLITGILLNLAQVGILLTFKPLQPKFDRLNPISGFKKFTSIRTLMEAVKSVSKLLLVGFIVWLSFRSRLPEFIALMQMSPEALLPAVAALVVAVWWRVALAMIILGLIDLLYQRWQHDRDLRMTHQEGREEMKELEGDPRVKQRVRQLQRQVAMQRMMADVPTADVIVTNPTHYAVALRYDAEHMAAPTVIAKGARLLAQRIRDIATENDVPVVQKPELARTLYRSIEVGQTVPEELFIAVAEVLSFVYQIDRRTEKVREREHLFAGPINMEDAKKAV